MKAWFLIIALVILATFFPLFIGHFYAVGDMRDVFIPLELFFQKEMRAGHLPAWNPNVAWGYPVIAAAQIGFFYPPLLVLRFLPIWLYLPATLLGHFMLLAVGLYYFLRRQGTSEAAAYLGSISFTLSQFVLQHLTHLNITLALAWLPWQLIGARYVAPQQKIRARHISLLSILLALPFLAGHLHIPFLMALGTAIYFMYEYIRTKRKIIVPITLLAIITLVTFALTAAQLLPTLELLHYSSRGAQGDFDLSRANQLSFPVYHLPTLLFPHFYGHDNTYWGKRLEIEYGIFIGTIPVVIALWMMWRGPRSLRFWKYVVGISFLLALGSLSPFRLLGFEPSLWFFSAPARWLMFTTLGLTILAAHGFDQLRVDMTFRKFSIMVAGIVIALVGITNAFLLNEHFFNVIAQKAFHSAQELRPQAFHYDSSYYITKLHTLWQSARENSVSLRSPFTLTTLFLLILAPWIIRKPYAVLTLTTLELIFLAATTTPTLAWKDILSPPDTLRHLPGSVREQQARIFSVRSGGDTGALFTDPASRANAHTRAEQRDLLVPLLHAQFGIPGVEWPASLDLVEHTKALEKVRGTAGYEIKDITAAEALNIGAIVAPTDLANLPLAIPKQEVKDITVYALDPHPRLALQTDRGEAGIPYPTSLEQQLTIHIDAPPSTHALLIRDTWYPGWRASIDGQPVSIERAEGFFRSIKIPSGIHTIRLWYQPAVLYAGIGLSLLTLVLCFLSFYKRSI